MRGREITVNFVVSELDAKEIKRRNDELERKGAIKKARCRRKIEDIQMARELGISPDDLHSI